MPSPFRIFARELSTKLQATSCDGVTGEKVPADAIPAANTSKTMAIPKTDESLEGVAAAMLMRLGEVQILLERLAELHNVAVSSPANEIVSLEHAARGPSLPLQRAKPMLSFGGSLRIHNRLRFSYQISGPCLGCSIRSRISITWG
jgi:hypothetical protein